MEVFNVFHTPAILTEFTQHKSVQSKYLDVIHNVEKQNHSLNSEHPGTFVSHLNLHLNPIFGDLMTHLQSIAPKIKEMFDLKEGVRLGVDKMWATVTKPGGSIDREYISMSHFAGMYFLQSPKNGGTVRLFKSVFDRGWYDTLPITHANPANTKDFTYVMPEGIVMLYPNVVDADTTANQSDKSRFIIHFGLSCI